ncbi:PRC-barrel domain containing protein [Paludibaculum fermentans]|uniref:PRC-barrel domain containing protein n=2 Tax=Paludibaculum fermentans TaxID=1473598 RepID=A0A7S7SNW5_PALFE|nr:PRC-barrel domain containing protein [Paludibaculum fermentans]
MLTSNRHLKNLVIRATDGEIGTIDQLYFDDQIWAVRYLTVNTTNWLDGRKVLISPLSILQTDWNAGRIDVSLTRKQVENAPGIDTHKPVSRQHEAEYFGYYGYPYYWDGPYMWGPSYFPTAQPPLMSRENALADRIKTQSTDSHLRSTEAVSGYQIDAKDGEIGHVDCFLIDDEAWAIRYLEVATKNWWPGKKVLLSPAWVERVSWEESKVFVAVTREAIQTCPEYLDTVPIDREYENRLYFHYGRPPYWVEEVSHAAAYAAIGR